MMPFGLRMFTKRLRGMDTDGGGLLIHLLYSSFRLQLRHERCVIHNQYLVDQKAFKIDQRKANSYTDDTRTNNTNTVLKRK